MKVYAPREFGKLIGRSTSTLQRWDRKGILPAKRTLTNRRFYTHDDYMGIRGQKPKQRLSVAYFRVSSHAQKKDLESQKQAVENLCFASGRILHERLEDIGSGLNYKRKNFVRLMSRVEKGEIKEILVAHKDRLVRFGYEWFEDFCTFHGTELIVLNQDMLSPEQEMTQDLLSIIHCFSSRLYGLRKYKKTILRMATENEKS